MSSDFDINKGRYWQLGVELVSGCTPCSPGCDHCWSAGNLKRFWRDQMGNGHCFFDGRAIKVMTDDYSHFNGKIVIHPDRLKRFNTRKPKVFAIWNDLFHEGVPFEFIDKVYESICMARAGKHEPDNTYLILTKRPQQLIKYINNTTTAMGTPLAHSMENYEVPWMSIWHGLTVCNQAEADEKIPIFLQVPGKKFLSIEPMLGAIDIKDALYDYNWHVFNSVRPVGKPKEIDAVILGGETGPGARPLHPDWVRSVRDQCAAAGVPFFFKQWGEWWGDRKLITRTKQSVIMGDTVMHKVGRTNAGRELDGRTHDDLPWVKKMNLENKFIKEETK